MPEYRIKAVVVKQFQSKAELNEFINTEMVSAIEVLKLCHTYYRVGQLEKGSQGLKVVF
jgi:hypothetical protein